MSTRALIHALGALALACGACADGDAARPLAAAAERTIAAAPTAAEMLEGDLSDRLLDAPPGTNETQDDALLWPMAVWPLRVPRGDLDGIARRGPELVLAVREPGAEPGVDPDVLSISATRLGQDGDAREARRWWHAGVIGASPVALTVAPGRVVAAWTQLAYPGRDLGLVVLDDGEPARYQKAPVDGDALVPVGRPLVASAGDAVVVCTATEGSGTACAALDDAGDVGALAPVAGMNRYHPFALVPVDDALWLFAADADVRAPGARAARVVMQTLGPDGRAARSLRHMMTLAAEGLVVVPILDGALMVGRRPRASDATAFIVTERRVRELEGEWNRTEGGLQTAEGALLFELETLSIANGFPQRGLRPRRMTASGERLAPAPWPSAVAGWIPGGTRHHLIGHNGVAAILAREGPALVGVAVGPDVGPPMAQPEDPRRRRRGARRR